MVSGACLISTSFSKKRRYPNIPCKVVSLVFVLHVVHLVGDALKPVLGCLNTRDHCSDLGTDYSLRVEGLAEDFALGNPSSTKSK